MDKPTTSGEEWVPTKPSDIPDDIWILAQVGVAFASKRQELIARAIMAERERCSASVRRLSHGVVEDPYEQGWNHALSQADGAIRKMMDIAEQAREEKVATAIEAKLPELTSGDYTLNYEQDGVLGRLSRKMVYLHNAAQLIKADRYKALGLQPWEGGRLAPFASGYASGVDDMLKIAVEALRKPAVGG